MAKKKLLEDIKARPARFYRVPADVMRDRRFNDSERLDILKAWAAQRDEWVEQVGDALADMERRLATSGHDAE